VLSECWELRKERLDCIAERQASGLVESQELQGRAARELGVGGRGGGGLRNAKGKFSKGWYNRNQQAGHKEDRGPCYLYLPINKVHDDNALEHPKCFVSIGAMNTIVSGQIILGWLEDGYDQSNSCEEVGVEHVE